MPAAFVISSNLIRAFLGDGYPVAAINYGRLASPSCRCHLGGREEGLGAGQARGRLADFVVCVFCREVVVTCPNPSLVFEEFENLPRFPNPSLTGSHQTRCGGGEQILQVSAILRPILGNVHGANLKLSELI